MTMSKFEPFFALLLQSSKNVTRSEPNGAVSRV